MEGRGEVETMTIREIDDSQLLEPPDSASRGGDTCMVDVEVGVAGMLTSFSSSSSSAAAAVSGPVSGSGKRKRGRPPRGQGRGVVSMFPEAKEEEEDVCFICFDGGSLVLCDRKGCPKAYHPACIKRDEAFFRSKAKWNCGWHICSSCQKASHHMCYTCTYSLCKGCTRNADYYSVRGNKGFCGTCMRTIMLIENITMGNKEMVQVDFDDKGSWEYLFKIYWVCLKNQLSLTLDELIKAKNPWKGDERPKYRTLWIGANGVVPKGLPLSEFNIASNEKCTKIISQPDIVNKENTVVMGCSGFEKSTYLPPEGTTWATKELLEFVAYMKNGDVSILSKCDVLALLVDYIRRNNLCDPHQKSQIVCDSRLMTLFGKACVGHLEMLKLLDSHFLKKEKSALGEPVRAGAMDADSSRVDVAACCGNHVMTGSDRRCKAHKKADERGSEINANPEEYAAIDVHNINLLYLNRSLIDKLLEDADKFHEKVVGSFVRIKISGGDQKLDAYRLVQVIGTSKVTEACTAGTRTTDVMLEILNLDKKEIVSIDGVSNQDFSEDECRLLRHNMKCGLIKPPTVGEILGKAMMLRAVKVTDWLEAEILRLNHLRNQASEKGKMKQVRECVEKLELLNSSNERQRRLHEIPKVRADPKMDPSYESEEDSGVTKEKKPGRLLRPRNASLGRKVSQCGSNAIGSSVLYDMRNRAPTYQSSEKSRVVVSNPTACEQSNKAVRQSEMSVGIAIAAIPPAVPEGGANDNENEKLWYYQDPTGKVQGPFAMMQLRKWSAQSLLPLDLKVWRADEKQDDSVLLTDALVGRYTKELPLPQEVPSASTDNDKSWESESNVNPSNDTSWADSKIVESKSVQNYSNARNNPKTNSELMNTIFGSDSPSWTTSVTVTAAENIQPQSSIQGCDMSNTNSRADKSQLCSKYSPPSSEKLCEIPSPQERKDHGDEKLSADFGDVKAGLTRTAEGQSHAIEVEEKKAESEVYSSHSPGQNRVPLAMNGSSSGWASSSGVFPDSKYGERLKNTQEHDFSNFLNPAPEQSNKDLDVQSARNQPRASSNILPLGSGPSWSVASSMVVDGPLLPGVRGEWCGYTTAPTKPSIDGWDSNLVPESSMRPTEVANDHAATPTSGTGVLTLCSETHLTIDADGFDESVSDLLAEVEAMESLGGLPSPTSRMTSGGELAHCSDNGCFSPGEDFGPMLDLGKNDALSSTGGMRIQSNISVDNTPLLQLSLAPSHAAVAEQFGMCQMPSQLAQTHEPLYASHVPSQSTLANELGASHVNRKSNSITVPVELPQTASGQSSNSTEVDGDTKLSDVSVNQRESGSELQTPISLNFAPEKAVSDIHHSPKSNPDAYSGNVIGSTHVARGSAAKGHSNMIWGSGHGMVQHQTSTTMANTTENAGSWAGNPRHGGERSSSVQDHRSYHQPPKDFGFLRDRSSWNRQPLLGVGNGGHSFRSSPKGQRVCKYYESGYCRKGASCTYWHPGP